jgi:hypothetical protein
MRRWVLVSALCVGASLAVNAALVKIATSWRPSLRQYSHFRLIDYGSLTLLGVVGACVAWFVVVRITSSPRWLFLRLAVAVSVVLLLPDVWLIVKHEPIRAVAVLMTMHLAMALLTYNLLVHLAPSSARPIAIGDSESHVDVETSPGPSANNRARPEKPHALAPLSRRAWTAMATAVGVEFLIGLGELFYVPYNRPNGWISTKGEAISLVHALLGGFLGIAAIAIVVLVARHDRLLRSAAWSGLIGVALGALGGTLCYDHSLRLVGMGMMFVGVTVAFFGYLIPLIAKSMHTPPRQHRGPIAASDSDDERSPNA